MSRPLTVFLPVVSDDVEALRRALMGDPGAWLPHARPEGPDRWHTRVRLGPLTREVSCTVGPVRDENGSSVWRDVEWTPVAQPGDRLPVHETLPTFTGELGLHAGRAVLILDGSYDVPGGRLGEFADAVALSGAARATASRLLADIAQCALALAPRGLT